MDKIVMQQGVKKQKPVLKIIAFKTGYIRYKCIYYSKSFLICSNSSKVISPRA